MRRIDEDRAGVAREAILNAMKSQNIGVSVQELSLPHSARPTDADVENLSAAARRSRGRAWASR